MVQHDLHRPNLAQDKSSPVQLCTISTPRMRDNVSLVCGSYKLIPYHNRLQYRRITVKLIANQITAMAIHPKRPGIGLDRVVLNPIAYLDLFVAVIPWKDAYLALGWCLKAEIEGDAVAQVSDAVDPLKGRRVQSIALDLRLDRLPLCGVCSAGDDRQRPPQGGACEGRL
jgi:hypothetical protein